MSYDELLKRRGILIFDSKTINSFIGGSVILELVKQNIVGIEWKYNPRTLNFEWLTMSPIYPPVPEGADVPIYDISVDIDLNVKLELPTIH